MVDHPIHFFEKVLKYKDGEIEERFNAPLPQSNGKYNSLLPER